MYAESPNQALADPAEWITQSPALRHALQLARRAAESDAAILLLGEVGTGKEHLAQAVHQWSARSKGPFAAVHCATQPTELLEKQLFGVAGGIAGEISGGSLLLGHRGTLFLQDVHAAPAAVQVRLLRVLQERRFERLSEPGVLETDARIIAASTRDLYGDVLAGSFREDLYWHLNVIPIQLPPLRRRREDIEPLVRHFVEQFGRLSGRRTCRISPDAMELMTKYGWPGNIRELQTYVARAVILAEGDALTPDLLPGAVRGEQSSDIGAFRGADPKSLISEFVHNEIAASNGTIGDLHARIVSPVERELLIQVMRLCNDVQKKAADQLGMNRNTLHKKLKEHKIE